MCVCVYVFCTLLIDISKVLIRFVSSSTQPALMLFYARAHAHTPTHTHTAGFGHTQPALSLLSMSAVCTRCCLTSPTHTRTHTHAHTYVTHANMLISPSHTCSVSLSLHLFLSVSLCLSTFVHPAQNLAATFKRHGDHGEAEPSVASPPAPCRCSRHKLHLLLFFLLLLLLLLLFLCERLSDRRAPQTEAIMETLPEARQTREGALQM